MPLVGRSDFEKVGNNTEKLGLKWKTGKPLVGRYAPATNAPTRKEQDLEKIPVADVLSIFIDDRPDLYVENSDAQKYLNRIGRLKECWGKLMLSEVTRTKCREYQQHRGNKGGARRDLEDLRAAIANHAPEGLHRGIVKVTLPKKGPARDRWLTRDE